MKAIIDYMYRKNGGNKAQNSQQSQGSYGGGAVDTEENTNKENKMMLEELTGEKNERKLKIRRPIIFICNNPYTKGLKTLRDASFVFNFQRNHEAVVSKLQEICPLERICVTEDTLKQLCGMFDGDLRGCLNFLSMFVSKSQRNQLGMLNLDSHKLNSLQFSHKNYFDLLGFIFNKRQSAKRYTTRSALFTYIQSQAVKS